MHGNFTKCTGVFDWFDKEEQVINAYKKFDSDRFRICTVGRLVKAKGYDRLLFIGHSSFYNYSSIRIR